MRGTALPNDAAFPWKTDRIGNEPLHKRASPCSHGWAKTGAMPSAAGVPPFERCRVGVSGLPPYKERPARRESSLKTRTCRRALHLWAGRADAPMLPPVDIGAEARRSQTERVVKIPLLYIKRQSRRLTPP